MNPASAMALDLGDGLRVQQLTTSEELEAHRESFVWAYQTIFAGPPYFEQYQPEEADGIYRQLTRTPGHLTMIATRGLNAVVGFGIAIPLEGKQDVARELRGLIPIQHSFYLAELGVLEEFRARGLGRTLVFERLRRIDRSRYNGVVLRVAATRNASYDMYRAMGFEDMGVYMEVPSMRTDGRVTTDRRLFLYGSLDQLQTDETSAAARRWSIEPSTRRE